MEDWFNILLQICPEGIWQVTGSGAKILYRQRCKLDTPLPAAGVDADRRKMILYASYIASNP